MLRSTPRAVMTVVITAALALSPISTAGGATDIFDSGVSAEADFDSLKAAGNTDAQDLWSDGTTMYVSDSVDGKIYAYAMSTPRERDAPKDLDLHADNANPYGIWSDDTTLWVADRAETYVYAYTLADGTHDADKGFDLVNSSADARNEAPAGLWSDGTFLWVFDAGSRPAAHLYSLVDGHVVDGNTYDYGDFFEQRWQFYTAFDAWSERSTSNPTAKNAWAVYDFHDGGTPGQYTGILHGEDFDTGRNDSDFDFRVPGAAGLNGVWSADGSTFWALSNRDDKIYSVMPPVVPSAPEDLTAAEAGSSGSLTLTWSAVPDEDKGSSDIVGYEVRYRQLDSGDWTSVRRSSPLAVTETVTGLVDYIDYAVAVRALNGQLPSDWVEATAIPTEPAAAGTPPAPQALTATGQIGGFELSWTAPTVAQGTAAITGYDVRYRFAETSSRGAWVVDDPITDPAITTATVSGVRKLAKYDIQVRAVNGVGGGAWATVTPGGIVRDGFKDLHEVTGVWSNDSTMWVAGRNEIRAFSLATGARDEADDFSSGELFSAEALVVSGDVDVDDYYIEAIWSDGTYLWVAYSVFAPDIYSQRFVNAYNLETQARVESQDFGRLLPPRYSMVIRDMWSDGETMWVLDSVYSYAFAFDLDTKVRAPHHEFSVGPRSLYRKPNGGWTDGVTIWIHWEKDRNVEAFDLVTKERVPQADSSLVARGSSTGINNAGARIWADEGSAWFSTGSRLVAFDLLRRPGLPADAAVVNGDKKVTVSWEQSDSGGQPTGYEVQYRADRETSWRDVSRADSAAVSETISGLVNRTLYDIRVRGVLDGRHGPWAELLASPALAPDTLGAPEGLTVAGDTETGLEGGRDRALDISWGEPAGATPSTTYDVQYRLDGTRGRWTSAASGATDRSVRVTGLVAGGRYQVRVNAVENHQWGPWAVAANRAGRGFYNLERLQVQWGCSGCLERFNGIWSDGSTLWLTVEDVYPPSSLRAYDLGSKERLYAEDVVDLPLSTPHGLWGDDFDFFIVDNPEWSVRVLFEPPHGVAKAGQVSKEADESFALGRRSGNGFSNPMHLAGNDAPLGVWSDGTTIWVSDGDDVKIYAYYASTGERNRDEDFDTLKIADGGSPVAVISLLRDDVVSMQRPYGLWSDGTTMWVADRVTDRIFAFDLVTKARDPLRDLGPFDSDVQLADIWGDGDGRLFVLDSRSDGASIFTVNLPDPPDEPVVADAETSSRTVTVSWGLPDPNSYGSSPLRGFEVWYRLVPESLQGRSVGRGSTLGEGSVADGQARAVGRATNGEERWVRLPLTETTGQEIRGLVNGRTYQIAVRAVNYETSSNWETVEVVPRGAPSLPSGLSASPDGSGALNVAWSAPLLTGTHEISEYTLHYAEGSTPDWTSSDVTRLTVTGTSHRLTGLTNGTLYSILVRAQVSTNNGSWAGVQATPLALSGPPNITSVTEGGGELEVAWTAPSNVGGSSVIDYAVRYRVKSDTPDEEADWTVDSSAVTSSPWTIDRLANGVRYEVGVGARNSQGRGEWSVSGEGTPSTLPDPPTSVTAFGSNTEIVVNWSAPGEDGGLVVDRYEVRYRLKSPPGPWTDVGGVQGVGVRTLTFSGLVNGVAYDVCVRAHNGKGLSDCGQDSATPSSVPSQPDGLVLTHGDRELALEWDTPRDGGAALDAYQVRYRVHSPPGAWREDPVPVNPSARPWTVSGLRNGVEYDVEVRAHNANGYGPPAARRQTPSTVPGASAPVRVVAGDTTLSVTWSAPGDDGGSPVTGYTVSRRQADQSAEPFAYWATVYPGDDLSAEITGLANGTAYDVCVRAFNSDGDGECGSRTATPATVPDAPGQIDARPLDRAVLVSWEAPVRDGVVQHGGAPITSYKLYYSAADGTGTGRTLTARVRDPEQRSFEARVPSLANNRTYAVRVRAVNSAGEGDSAEISVTPLGRPGAVDLLSVSSRVQAIAVSWQPPVNGNETQVTGYEARYRAKSSSAPWITIPSTVGDSAASVVIDELVPAQVYEVEVRAVNAADLKGPWSKVEGASEALSGLAAGRASAHETASMITFTVRLDSASHRPVRVNYSTSDGTATAGEDYVAVTATATIRPGETETTIDVDLIPDALIEEDETFTLTLTDPVGAQFPGGEAVGSLAVTGTIIDDVSALRANDLPVGGGSGGGGSGGGGSGGGGSGGGGGGGSSGGGGSESTATIVVSNGWSPADMGLAAVLSARTQESAVLYTSADQLSVSARKFLEDYLPASVLVIGGESAIDASTVANMGRASEVDAVERIAGATRIATAAAVARRVLGEASAVNGAVFIVANGWSPADVGAAAVLSARTPRSAVLYTAGDDLSEEAAALLGEYRPVRVVIVGGEAAVSAEVEQAIGTSAVGAQVERVAGATRTSTAAAVARRSVGPAESTTIDDLSVIVVNGWSAPDIGVAAALSARTEDSVVVYADAAGLPDDTEAFLRDYQPARVIIVGGAAAVTSAAVEAIRSAAPDARVPRYSGATRTQTAATVARRILGNP